MWVNKLLHITAYDTTFLYFVLISKVNKLETLGTYQTSKVLLFLKN